MDVVNSSVKRGAIWDAVIETAPGPHIAASFEAEGEAAFDELHRLFERNVRGRCKEEVQMIGHDDVGV